MRWIELQIIHTGQALHIDQILVLPRAIAHADKGIGSPDEGSRLAVCCARKLLASSSVVGLM